MTVLEWDQVGERVYQSGIDRGVLYLKDGRAVPWNGITSVEDNTSSELKSYYLDGIKILDHVTPGDFQGKITAFTYPDEFDEVLGIVPIGTGLLFHEQEHKSFNLSYRTQIHSDVEENYGYKIHLLYNVRAVTDSQVFGTLSNEASANEFSWALSGVPTVLSVDGARPTVHVSLDSTEVDPTRLQEIENILYGTETTSPRFPSILELRILFGDVGSLFILDNGDGTWTAIDPADQFITVSTEDEFQIDHANVTYLDADTYEITDTEYPLP
jgi:hypothetical protein